MRRFWIICLVLLLSFLTVSAQELAQNIDLSQLIIDDFSNYSDRFLPYSEASHDDILRARNRIRPFCRQMPACFEPQYETVSDAVNWLGSDDLIIGYHAADGSTYAFPLKVLHFHEIVNDDLGDEPILVSYNPHSNNVAVYSRQIGENTLDFGNASIYYQNLAMLYDARSESLWLSSNGQALVGDYAGEKLQRLPFLFMTWQEWRSYQPSSLVLSRRPNYVDYEEDFFSSYETRINLGRFVFPIADTVLEDRRLDYAAQVLVIETASTVKAYSLESLNNQLFFDTLDGQSILIMGHTVGDINEAMAFHLQLEDGSPVATDFENIADVWQETSSASTLDYSGYFISGSLNGHHLVPIASAYMYWFAAVASYPQLELYQFPDN